MTDLTINQPLCAIVCKDGVIHLKKSTKEYVTDNKKNGIRDMDGVFIDQYNIDKIRDATTMEYFKVYVLPDLPPNRREIFFDMEKIAREKKLNPSLNAIMETIKKKLQEEEYYNSKPLTPEELERRREQVKNRPRLNLS